MRITGWNIDGFGMFNNAQVTGLPNGLTVIYGPNEAGKSTTLAFIRGVLFGFPKGNTKEPKYPPLNGGRHGGRLFLDDKEGSWTIERLGIPSPSLAVTLPDGSAGTADDLARLMTFADKEIFRNIFAFDLTDLDIRSLDSEAVKDRVFASTQTGAGVSPSQARKLLDAQIAKLLKPRAKSALINGLEKALINVEQGIREARSAAESYPLAMAERDRLGEDVHRLSESQAITQAELNRVVKLESLWDDWFLAGQAKEELAGIEAPDDFPEDIRERLADADAAIGEAKRAIATVGKQRAEEKKRLARITIDDRLAKVESELEALFRAVSAYEENLKQLSILEGDAKAEKKKVHAAISNLGSGWDRERVASFDASIPAAGKVATWSDRLRAADTAQNEAASVLRDATQRALDAHNERSRLEKEVTDSVDVALGSDLDELESRISGLRALITDRVTAEARLENAEQMAANLSLSPGPGTSDVMTPTRKTLYVFAALLAFASVAAFAMGQLPAGAVLAIATVGAGVLGYRAGHSNQSLAVDTSGADPRIQEESERLATRRSDLHRVEDGIRALASLLSLPSAPTSLQVEDLGNNLAHQRTQRAALDRLSAELDRAAEQERKVDKQVQDLEDNLASEKGKKISVVRDWDTWRTDRGIPEPMAPDMVAALFQSVKACRDSIARLEQVEEQAHDLHNTVRKFEQRADDALTKAGEEAEARGSALAAALGTMHKRVLADQKFRADKESLETGIRGTSRELEKIEVELSDAEQRRVDVLTEVSVTDEAELLKLSDRVKRRRDLALEINDRIKRVDASLGLGASADEMRTELSDGKVDEWKARKAAAEEQARNLAEQRDEAVRVHQDALQEVERISESSDVAQLEIAAEGLRQETADAIGQWQRLALARALIDDTVTRFEKNNQGPVVERASSLFKTITDGHYPRLLAHEGALDVENSKGKRISVESLSTGTAQQVYLCLRLGLAEARATKQTSLPLIMDEVLVNFDKERALGVAKAILDVSERHQILMFTCHAHTVELMQSTSGDVRVVELDRFVGLPR